MPRPFTFLARSVLAGLSLATFLTYATVSVPETLPGTRALEIGGDLAGQMVSGIDRFLDHELAASIGRRPAKWRRDFSTPEAYERSIESNRAHFQKIVGVVDARVKPELRLLASPTKPAQVGAGTGYRIFAVRWSVLRDMDAEGLLLQPDREPVADVVALPDCDWTPEMIAGIDSGGDPDAQFARRLAEGGSRVLVPFLLDRRDTYSGNPAIRMTNQPHREFVYRAAFVMSRHIIGYEVQKVLAAVDWFAGDGMGAREAGSGSAGRNVRSGRPVGVVGYGEGGLIAFYAAAVDRRFDAALVSGYFKPREDVWREPIYRNVFGLLDEFGDAEIASLIAPRALIVEASRHPVVNGPPPPSPGRAGAAPGVITTPPLQAVAAEFVRAQALVERLGVRFTLVKSGDGTGPPGSETALAAFLKALQVELIRSSASGREAQRGAFATGDEQRGRRQFDQLVEQTQRVLREGEKRRAEAWTKPKRNLSNAGFPLSLNQPGAIAKYSEDIRSYRDDLWDEVIGRFPAASLPADARTRLIYDEPKYRGYEVVLDVWPEVFACGILLVPKDLKPGERRPVVVCQHGLEGRPQDCADPRVESRIYHRFANRLAERGFIAYAPQNPYIGKSEFRELQRKLNPLKKTLFAVMARQHERTLEWLALQPFVDAERIAFYGMSYGGKSAMRLPAMIERYCLSICSGDFIDWTTISSSTTTPGSYLFTGEYEVYEFNLGNTFNYAELSWLICPRPFMVERGRFDGPGQDGLVAAEFAKTQRRYDLLGLGDHVAFEAFDGGHEIHAVGTFEFLHRHLNWPPPAR
jgi:dienelactone hydrolase